MKPAAAWTTSAALALGLVLVHEGTLVRIASSFSPEARDLGGVVEVRELIRDRWVEETAEGQLLDGALHGMVRTLDPYSDFISAAELQAFEESTTGKFGGLGIYITVEDGVVVVIAPIEDTPAWEAGMRPGDRILAVDGVPCEFGSDDEAVRHLKGEAGTSVTLSVLHEGATHPVNMTIERAVIQIRSVKGTRLLDPATRVGYTRLTTFNSGTVEEFRAAMEELSGQGMRALVLDLRGNPGGFLAAATEVADAFLDEGQVIVQTRGRGAEATMRETKAEAPRSVTVPTAVLIDRGSASASEILAGALRDQDRALLVGARSFGKGSVQSILPVLGGSAELKLTTQYYFTPSGRRIHRGDKPEDDPSWGLVPDLPVEIDRRVRDELSVWERDREMELRKARASATQPPEIPERLHRDDPQVRGAYRALLERLGEPAAAGSDVAAVDSQGRAPERAPERAAGE